MVAWMQDTTRDQGLAVTLPMLLITYKYDLRVCAKVQAHQRKILSDEMKSKETYLRVPVPHTSRQNNHILADVINVHDWFVIS